jgi:polysaccharide biosynthesis protein PslJ
VRVIAASPERGPIVSVTIAASSVALLGLTTLAGLPTAEVAMVLTAIAVMALGYRTLMRWHVLLVMLLLVIMFIPIKRYELPGNLPFDMEPYRVVVLLIFAGWVISLLVDPRTKLRRSGLEGPLALLAFATLGSVLVNGPRVDELRVGPEVVKALMFFGSFVLVFYLIISVIRSYEHVRVLVKTLVAGGAVISTFAIVEAQTGFNLFDQLATVIPMLSLKEAIGDVTTRGGRLRVFGSAQGPIALSAALVMLLPLAFYLAKTAVRPVPWWIATGLLTLGGLATGSRTSVVMIAVIGIVFLWLRPVATRRAMAILLIPAVIGVHMVLPGTIGSLRASFFPEGGLIAEQSTNPGWRGSGRLADVGPTIDEFVEKPLLGQGYGTRITGRGAESTALILDNQWLKTLVETGAVGTFAFIWLFVRFARTLGRHARHDHTERGWLITALVASVLAFAVAQFFYDAFAFVQVTFLLYIMLALGSVLVTGQIKASTYPAHLRWLPPVAARTAPAGPRLAPRT